MNMNSYSMQDIEYHWDPLNIGETVFFEFSKHGASSVRQLPKSPSVYRWAVYEGLILRKAYIGESESLQERIYQYFHPGPSQQTNLRLNKTFNEGSQNGLTIRLEILRINPVELNHVRLIDQRRFFISRQQGTCYKRGDLAERIF